MDANKVMFKERSSEYRIILLKLPFKCFLGKAIIFLFQFIRDVLALKLTQDSKFTLILLGRNSQIKFSRSFAFKN